MIANKSSFEPHSADPLPNSNRVFISGEIFSSVKVPFREIKLSPTKSPGGRAEHNEPVHVYDCYGPWGDPGFHGQVAQGLPALRRDWILSRNDVEGTESSYKPIAG